jgi:hypothetical protein
LNTNADNKKIGGRYETQLAIEQTERTYCKLFREDQSKKEILEKSNVGLKKKITQTQQKSAGVG